MNMDLSTSRTALLARSQEIGAGLAGFLGGLWELMESIEPLDWQPGDPDETWEKVREENSYFFAIDAPALTAEYIAPIFDRVFDYVAPATPGLGEQVCAEVKAVVAGLSDADVRIGLADAARLMRLITGRLKQLPKGDDPLSAMAAVHLSVISALSPTATAAAAKLQVPERKTLALEDGHCPVCGRPADIGAIEEAPEGHGGKRHLWCSFCGATWDYERIRCTRCGTRVQSELTFHFNEDDRARRIYYCKSCSGSQKIVALGDLASLADFDLRVESVVMAGLEDAVSKHNEQLLSPTPAGLKTEQES